MSSKKLTDELLKNLAKATSEKEMAEILEANGQELTEEEMQILFKELSAHASELTEQELSLDELDAVSGGSKPGDYPWDHVDWLNEGCYATVEPGSWCGISDDCVGYYVNYNHPPVKGRKCPQCGGWMTEFEPGYFLCRELHSVIE